MERQLACPHCHKPVRLAATVAGPVKVLCPLCRKPFLVPAPAPVAEVLAVTPVEEEVLDALPADPSPEAAATISFACPCGKHLRVPASAAGKRTRCPKCGKVLPIPSPRAIVAAEVVRQPQDEPAPEVVDEPEPAPRRHKPSRTAEDEPARTGPPPDAPVVGPAPKWPVNGVIVVAAVVAGLTMLGVLATPWGWLGVEPFGFGYAFLCAFPAAIFGGIFATAAATHAAGKHSLYAGVCAGVLTLLFAVLVGTLFAVSGTMTGQEGEQPTVSLGSRIAALVLLVVLVPLGYLLGGWLERGVTSLARSIHPRQRWTYRTHDGLSFPVYGPWRHPFLAAMWKLLGWFFILTCWAHIYWVDGKPKGFRDVIAAIILGKVCFILAKKRRGTSAREALEKDDRPPIIYLRSFQDDGMAKAGSLSGITEGTQLLSRKTLEERLIEVLGRYGPVVAIGRPGEDVPELGAARLYVGDDHWKDLITDLLAERKAIALLRAGETQGLRWELRKVGKMLSPRQLLLFLPFALTGSRATRDARYAAFREWASECFPADLPEKIDDVCLFYFDNKPVWKTHVVERKSPIPLGHPLVPVLERVQKSKALWRTRFFNWKRDRWVLLAVSPILLGLFVLCGYNAVDGLRERRVSAPPAPPPAPPVAVAPGPKEPPPREQLTRYEGKARSYHISLGTGWQPSEPNPNQDRVFARGDSVKLAVLVSDEKRDLADFGKDHVAGMKKKTKPDGAPLFKDVTLLDDRTVRVNGRNWYDFKLEYHQDGEIGWSRVRCYSDDEGTYFLQAFLGENGPALDVELTRILDSFEFPPPP